MSEDKTRIKDKFFWDNGTTVVEKPKAKPKKKTTKKTEDKEEESKTIETKLPIC